VWSASSLAQARNPRLGKRSALAQAAGSHLGRTVNKGPEGFTNSRLGKVISLERDGFSRKTQFSA